MLQRKGVINTVEVLVLIMIFLAVAALFATFLMSSTSKQAQTLKQEQQNVAIAFNPPVTVVGVITVEANVTGSQSKNGTIPIACVQETSGARWWLSLVQLQAGTSGALLRSYSPGQEEQSLLSNKDVYTNATRKYIIGNLTFVPLTHQNNTLAVCTYSNGTIYDMKALYINCDQEHDKHVINWYIDNVCKKLGTDYKLYLYNLIQYISPGAVAPVLVPIIRPEYGWTYTSYTVKVYFAEKILPNPGNIPQKVEAGEIVTWNELKPILESTGNVTSYINAFAAQCESCTFYVG
ncbi:hypothetical protein IPA_08975 [Ignicoccus pacificus DSM 13166]|uniref:Uncharacterized protein n=1 Tax=Ignicoccus pacificus DSM 13166 TaxID=940294 RepID=A0A977KD23_9CREN|nr:hypothetical protein IPA_08975 [Ignicoccus pacificus DSM 13166]